MSTKCQIVALNAPGKYLADKMLILWHFSGITAPVVSGYHACGEWLQEFRQLTACFISARTKSVSQHTVSFGLIRVPVPLLTSFVSTKLHCSSSSQISATSTLAAGDMVTLRGERF